LVTNGPLQVGAGIGIEWLQYQGTGSSRPSEAGGAGASEPEMEVDAGTDEVAMEAKS